MAKRTYENETIRVFWNSDICIHFAACLRLGGGVFDTGRRPWVDLSLADTETVVNAIEACPSGALRYERLDGRPGERPDEPTTVVPWPNGPLMVRGEIEVRDRQGETFIAGPRVALCRCGASKNQPFCDTTHRTIGFRDSPRVTGSRDDAQRPSDISHDPL